MNTFITRSRYYLEIISVPIFAFLVVHLAGHGLMLLADGDHDHDAHEGELGHDEHGHESLFDLEFLLSAEILGGLLALITFVWLWQNTSLKKLVPCAHEHCHHASVWPHLLASGAFVLHFFAESGIRYEILSEFTITDLLSVVGAIGFASHFLVDVIVMLLLSTFWKNKTQQISALVVMSALWLASLWVGQHGGLHLEGLAEPFIMLISAFLLAMFVHKPHKPAPECTTCVH